MKPLETDRLREMRDLDEFPPQDGTLQPLLREPTPPSVRELFQRSGVLHRPLHEIRRPPVATHDAVTELEQYKASLRRYAPVQKGRAGLPWAGQWCCPRCGDTNPGRLIYDATDDAMYLELDCPTCGAVRERQHDVLFVKQPRGFEHPRQPQRTHAGAPIRPLVTTLPKTVETLCPECGCLILGRCFVQRDAVWMEKTCPEHGYFRDKVNADARLYLKATCRGFQDERGVLRPHVSGAVACPTDCGLCHQHQSTTCLGQIDMTNRCNLNCPVCFASANAERLISEPTYEMVVELLQALRDLHPYPATAVQFTGGEPTIHPDFIRLVRKANELGFSHVQAATNGLRLAERSFAEEAARAGLHTLYLQFDGLDDEDYMRLRGRPLAEIKLRVIENCRATGMKVCLVPTIVKTVNEDQVPKILQFALDNIDVVSAISYQPVAFTGRISLQQLADQRYTLGDMAHAIADYTGADVLRDFFPLNLVTPLSRILQTLDGKPKIRPSCHSDCACGTYFFVTPDRQPIPFPKLFDIHALMHALNEHADRIERTRSDKRANWLDRLRIAGSFLRHYRWRGGDRRINPFTFIHALRGLTNKSVGRGAAGAKTYRTLMAAGMHFMDRYNYDTERIKRCVILYSTADGFYPFCTINGGPIYRPYIERMYAREPQRTPAKAAESQE